MEIYSINIDDKKFKQYKTFEDSLVDMNLQINNNPNSKIEIILEDFCDNGYFDTGCKTYLLCEYKNNKMKKYF